MNNYAKQIRRLQELGPRTSGSHAHQLLIEDVAGELAAMGYEVQRDTHVFEKWDVSPEKIGLTVAGQTVAVSSAWPYSGETKPGGVTAPLVYLPGRLKKWKTAAGKIAVVEVRNLDVPTKLLVDSWNDELPFSTASNPVIGSELSGTDLTKAREAGVLGVIAVWREFADDAAKAQYLPFTRDYQGVPAVWVPQSEANTVLSAAKVGATATLTLVAERTPNATMDTLWTVSPGSGPRAQESILVVTHSDGGNAVEENGHLGLLELARDAAASPHARSIVFVYTAGHLRIPAVTTHGQATTAWLTAHPELWSADTDGLCAVAGLVIEHLGARHYAIDPATHHYGPTHEPEPELLYATTGELAALARETWSGVEIDNAVPVKPGALVHFGEGEPLFQHLIPAIALVTGPVYLLAETNDDVVDLDVLARQIDSFRRLQAHLAGPVDAAAFGKVKLPGKLQKAVAAAKVLRFVALHR